MSIPMLVITVQLEDGAKLVPCRRMYYDEVPKVLHELYKLTGKKDDTTYIERTVSIYCPGAELGEREKGQLLFAIHQRIDQIVRKELFSEE